MIYPDHADESIFELTNRVCDQQTENIEEPPRRRSPFFEMMAAMAAPVGYELRDGKLVRL